MQRGSKSIGHKTGHCSKQWDIAISLKLGLALCSRVKIRKLLAAGESFAHFTVKILNFTLLTLFKIKIAGAFLWAFYYFYGHFKIIWANAP